MISKALATDISAILKLNPEIEAYKLARINTVEGLTLEHCRKWRWRIDENGRVNFPDYQMRLYKNDSEKIKWRKKIHENLDGFGQFTELPLDDDFCLIHEKTIERQEKQNNYYDSLINKNVIDS